MDHVDDDIKKAIAAAERFLSIVLAREPLSPATEKERSFLADWFKKLTIQLNAQSELTDEDKPPPRPVKGGVLVPKPVADQGNEDGSEDIYDDIAGADAKQEEYYSPMADGVEVEPKVANQPFPVEDYEVMNRAPIGDSKVPGSLGMANHEATRQNGDHTPVDQEDYEEPQQNQADEDYEITVDQRTAPVEEDSYEVTDTAAGETYEEAEPSPSPMEEDYEGVDGAQQHTGNGSLVTKSINWENLTKSVKPGDIDGVISKGTLWKHRKKGKVFVGSKYQKRFCVLRSFALYYFRDKSSDKQQGQILLPGYKVEATNRAGREFMLTRENDREYKFYASSKEEAGKWMDAIRKAASAPMSVRHSADLNEIRDKSPSGDEDSLTYEDVASSAAPSRLEETAEQKGDELYDDNVDENFYEAVGSGPAKEINYEISEAQASVSTEPIQEDNYEVADDEPPPAPPPPRPSKPQQQSPSEDENYEIAEQPAASTRPSPRPSKLPPQPEQEETYEVAEEPVNPTPALEEEYEAPDQVELPSPPQPILQEDNYEITEEETPVQPPPRPSKRAPPSPPQQKTIPEQPKRPAPEHPGRDSKNPEINYANVYQALWNCAADEDDELAFQRGDLIYIYEKPHSDWWIGSLFKPQGNCVGLVPKQYVMKAYEIRA